jgi:glycosyltransferase involved in cell wall biosynthesis
MTTSIKQVSTDTAAGSADEMLQQEMLQQVIDRIDDLQAIVTDELDVYRGARNHELDQSASKVLLSVVIPVFNEEATIARVVSRVAALPLNKEIVIVDDCSTDGTRQVLARLEGIPGIRVILQAENQGKGAALRTGFEHTSGDIVVIQDADLEYDPREIPGLLGPILRDEAEIVYGSRFIGEVRQSKTWIHQFGNGMLTSLSNWFSGLQLTDMETCYKAFRHDVLGCLRVNQNRFGIEPELTAKLARRGYRFVEVPISYNPRSYAEGKKIGVRDLFKAFYCIGRYGVAD